MMYMTFASLAIAQAYNVPLDLPTQLTMLLVLMLTSKGIAGVPRASLVIVLATCAMFNIPPEGVALILPIDHFCDMFRSMTNVVGNALATSVVSKWEGELEPAIHIIFTGLQQSIELAVKQLKLKRQFQMKIKGYFRGFFYCF